MCDFMNMKKGFYNIYIKQIIIIINIIIVRNILILLKMYILRILHYLNTNNFNYYFVIALS